MKNVKKFDELNESPRTDGIGTVKVQKKQGIFKFEVEYLCEYLENADMETFIKKLKRDIEGVGWTDKQKTLKANFISKKEKD